MGIIPILILLLACMSGCDRAELVPVEGTVTLDGKAIAGATVGLELIGGQREFRFFCGETDSSGRYVIQPFEHNREGALAGEYYVMIRSVKAPPGANEMTVLPKEPIPPEYQDGSKILKVPVDGITNADFSINTRKIAR